MKRRLVAKAAEFNRRSRNRTVDDSQQEEAACADVIESWDDNIDEENEFLMEDNHDDKDDINGSGKVKGVLSEKDKEILKTRRAETSRIENIVPYRNKQRALVFCSRGITSNFRHLMEDIRALLPHHKKDIKHDTKKNLYEINSLCDLKACNNCIFFEARKTKDLYMWISKTPEGPSVKFHVLNIHTMDELRLSGNCIKGSRPLLSFSADFESTPELILIKEMFTQIFGTPRGHPKSKPFIDHVMTFSVCDGKIWFRHFQITDSTTDYREIKAALKNGEETTSLVEIGPRFVLDLIKIFEGSFTGRTLASNPEYVTPNKQRSQALKAKGHQYQSRKRAERVRTERIKANVLPEDPVQTVFK